MVGIDDVDIGDHGDDDSDRYNSSGDDVYGGSGSNGIGGFCGSDGCGGGNIVSEEDDNGVDGTNSNSGDCNGSVCDDDCVSGGSLFCCC